MTQFLSVPNVLLGLITAFILYGSVGLPLARAIVGKTFGLWFAPIFGWAAHSALALPLLEATAFNRLTVLGSFVICGAVAIGMYKACPDSDSVPPISGRLLAVTIVCIIAVAFAFMAGGWPKSTAHGLSLAPVIFDHSKIAMIDEMTRLGVPPGNPFYGGPGQTRLVYYYLWHFSAAELSLLTHITGWEADSALSGFTGIATLAAIAGLSVQISGNGAAAPFAAVLGFAGAARPLLEIAFGSDLIRDITGDPSGFGGLLFQTSWAPQHTMSAVASVIAIIVLTKLIERPHIKTAIVLGLLMTAAFQSSTWVGGITFSLIAIPLSLIMWLRLPRDRRVKAVVFTMLAVLLALAMIAPFLVDQLQATALRHDGAPITIEPLGIVDDSLQETVGSLWNLIAYWAVYLPVELPATYLTGIAGLVWFMRGSRDNQRATAIALSVGVAMSLVCSWLLVSRLGENNDLGWRSALPAVIILNATAASFLARLTELRRPLVLGGAIGLLIVGVADGLRFEYSNIVAEEHSSDRKLASSPALWDAVRRLTPPDQRIANNPLFLADATPWPVNISWALMANRRSCFAGQELVQPFSTLPSQRIEELQQQFERLFSGNVNEHDVSQLAINYHCDTIVIVPSDGAWNKNPILGDKYYKLTEETSQWRIYRRVK